MDGIRGYWNGSSLLTRHGKDISPPSSFTVGLPNISLDGELWMGRGTFDQLLSLVNAKAETDWTRIGYYVYDLPSSSLPYEERQLELQRFNFPPNVYAVLSTRCRDQAHLEEYLEEILEKGGEGVILREPFSLYSPSLTSSMLKVKVSEYSSPSFNA